MQVSRGAVTNPECPGLTPDQLNQNSLGAGPRHADFFLKSSGESSVPLMLKVSAHGGEDALSDSWELQN